MVSEVTSAASTVLSGANGVLLAVLLISKQGFPGTCRWREPILVYNLISLIGLLVTCGQLPSSTEEGYLHFPPPLMHLWLCTGQDPPGVVMETMYLVPLIGSRVVRVAVVLAGGVSGSHLLPGTIPCERLRPVALHRHPS